MRARVLAGGVSDEVGIVVTGTDLRRHETLVWRTDCQPYQGDNFVEARWLGLLPTPGAEVHIEDIIDFKRQRGDELLRLRAEMEKLGEELANHERPERVAAVWKGRMQTELSTIARLMRESRWQIAWGSLKAILDIKPLGALKAIAALTHLPIELAVAGMAVNGIVEIGTQCIEHGRRKNQVLDGSPFAYLFSARESGLFE